MMQKSQTSVHRFISLLSAHIVSQSGVEHARFAETSNQQKQRSELTPRTSRHWSLLAPWRKEHTIWLSTGAEREKPLCLACQRPGTVLPISIKLCLCAKNLASAFERGLSMKGSIHERAMVQGLYTSRISDGQSHSEVHGEPFRRLLLWSARVEGRCRSRSRKACQRTRPRRNGS